jgi:hypothetical protein
LPALVQNKLRPGPLLLSDAQKPQAVYFEIFYGVFELLMHRKGQEGDTKIQGKNNRKTSLFPPQLFAIVLPYTFQKHCYEKRTNTP